MRDLGASMRDLEGEVAHLREVVTLLWVQLSSLQSTMHMLQKVISSLQDDAFEAKMEALDLEFGSYKPAKEEDDGEEDSNDNPNASDDLSDAANDASDKADFGDDDGGDNVDDSAFAVFDHPESD